MILILQLDCLEGEDSKNFLCSFFKAYWVNAPGKPTQGLPCPPCSSGLIQLKVPKCIPLQASSFWTKTYRMSEHTQHTDTSLPSLSTAIQAHRSPSQSSHALLEENKNPGFCLLLLLLFLKYYKKKYQQPH